MLELIPMEVLVFLLILSSLVLVHEWGHYIAAKLIGVRVEEFGIGLPPRAAKLFERKGTLFTLNWLPIGGFVKLKGEEGMAGVSGQDTFFEKPMLQRAFVLLAGVAMNFVLGVILFGIIYSILGIPTKTDRVRIAEVAQNSPAETAGLNTDNEVVSVTYNGRTDEINSTSQLVQVIDENKGKEIALRVKDKDGNERDVLITPRENPPANEGAMGVALSDTEMVKYPWYEMPFRGIEVGLKEAVGWGREIIRGIVVTVGSLVSGKGVSGDVAGPVGIYQISKQVQQFGILPTLQFMGVLSINLAILNILPFPALDGGRVAFLGIEKIIGKKTKDRIEGAFNMVGMALLLTLMAVITVRDILKLVL